MRNLPTGTVTFLFTDIEGSTRLLDSLGAEAYAEALAEHRRVIREACTSEGGVEVDTQGDAFFFAFPSAPGAIEAAKVMTDALANGPIQVRIGLHTGTPLLTDEGYVGADVHFGARVAATSHGGQIVLSRETRALVDGEITELGEHRLKDIPDAVPIYQLGSTSFPPLKTISNTNLPRPASSFVGRDDELRDVVSHLENSARLVTLTGPGGTGKTRLAIEAAAALVPEYKAGVFWVGLATLRDAALVAETIAQTLGTTDGLAEHIGERELLLLLDNLEQVIECAPELSALLESCPNLNMLVTSRELLRIQGEVEYAVPPLATSEAVELFCTRSRLDASDSIAELCHCLDDMPLAVELAAARTSVLTPAQILERLSQRLDLLKGGRDADPRQQTLRATIEWSYELLSAGEHQLFARLSVFAGGCTLDAANEVADADLDVLQSLVEKSLVRFTDGRYWMLETIRDYAVERLEASGEAEELRRRHASHFLAIAEEAEPHVRSGNPKEWLELLDREHDNFRAAFGWLAASGETELSLRLGGALWGFWNMRGHVTEGRRRLESVLSADERPSAARAEALKGAGALAANGGDDAIGRSRLEEALELYRQLGDPWGVASTELNLGAVAAHEGDLAGAQAIFEKSVEAFRELGDDVYALWATRLLAWMCYELGERDRARGLHEEVVAQARAANNEPMAATSLGALGEYAIRDGRIEDAMPLLEESTRIYQGLGDPWAIAGNLSRVARALVSKGRAAQAAQVLARSEALYEEAGRPVDSWMLDLNEETRAGIRAEFDDGAVAALWERGRTLTVDEAIALALEEAASDA